MKFWLEPHLSRNLKKPPDILLLDIGIGRKIEIAEFQESMIDFCMDYRVTDIDPLRRESVPFKKFTNAGAVIDVPEGFASFA